MSVVTRKRMIQALRRRSLAFVVAARAADLWPWSLKANFLHANRGRGSGGSNRAPRESYCDVWGGGEWLQLSSGSCAMVKLRFGVRQCIQM